jgi:hypothetical protein
MQKPRTPRDWYRFRNEAKEGDELAELFVYDRQRCGTAEA